MSATEPPPRQRSTSRSRRPPTRPTTPLRPPSRTSLRASTSNPSLPPAQDTASTPLDALEPAFGELADAVADLEANLMHVALLHDSVARFNDDFAAFLYGLNMSAFCVDFPEAPGPEAVRRFAERRAAIEAQQLKGTPRKGGRGDVDATFLTTDTSFVNDPPASVRAPKFAAPGATRGVPAAGTRVSTRGRGGGGIPTRGSSGAGRGAPSTRGASGIGRGRARGVR